MNQNVRIVTEADFETEVLQASETVLVDFWAEWCPPCRKLTPVIDALANEFAGRVKVAKLNVDAAPAVATRYNVYSIPTLLLFRGGQVIEQRVGFRSREELRGLLDAQQPQEVRLPQEATATT